MNLGKILRFVDSVHHLVDERLQFVVGADVALVERTHLRLGQADRERHEVVGGGVILAMDVPRKVNSFITPSRLRLAVLE